MNIFALRTVNFRWIFMITRKIKIGKLIFQSIEHIVHLLKKMGAKLRGGGLNILSWEMRKKNRNRHFVCWQIVWSAFCLLDIMSHNRQVYGRPSDLAEVRINFWPSPDLNPLDFYLWGYMIVEIRRKKSCYDQSNEGANKGDYRINSCWNSAARHRRFNNRIRNCHVAREGCSKSKHAIKL